MPSIQIRVEQIDKYSFTVFETLGEVPTVTSAILKFFSPFTQLTYEVDVTAKWPQIISANGGVVNISEFPGGLMDGYDYFPDGTYKVTMDVDTGTYTSTINIGFSKIIQDIVAQQATQSDWKLELSCSCEKYSTSFRKFNYLKLLEFAEANCLIDEYQEILEALYKLTGTPYEYQGS